jgi:sodium/potassium-transporting ATPase subunit alpha
MTERPSPAIHRLSLPDAFAVVRSAPAGLASGEAARRLAEYGPNQIRRTVRTPAIIRFIAELFRFFSVILWIAAGLAFLAEWAEPGEGMIQIGFAITAVIVISGLFSFWQEHRIERTLAALQRLLPQQTEVVRDGAGRLVPSEQLVVGDVIILGQGDNIPADCRLIEAFDVRVNTATVTGESVAHARDAAPSLAEQLTESRNILLAGTSLVAGQCKALIYASGANTEFGQIAHLAQTSRTTVSPLRRELARLSRTIAVLAVAIGVAFFAAGAALGVPFWKDLIFSIGIIVAMVPEGLLPTLTLSLVLAAQRMAKRNVLIRNLTSVETLGSATVICTDKTGTLTENRMEAREVFLDGSTYRVDEIERDRAIAARHHLFFACANFCHDVRESKTDNGTVLLGDPMEIALIAMHRRLSGEVASSRRLDEIPFDSARMRQAVLQETADGARLFCKGAPETVLPLCSFAFMDGEARPLDPPARATIVRAQEEMAERGLRVIALASRDVPAGWSHDGLEDELVFQGLVGLRDPPRPEVPQAIATEIGLVDENETSVITGERLRALSSVALGLALDSANIIFARVSAADKMQIVEALKRKGHIVAVTGDGANDAPALKAAHIGVAMGIAGTDVAKEVADVVLLDDNFASIVNAVEEGRAVFQNIRKFLTYVLVHNVAELVPYLAFALFRVPLALTPIQILLIDMGTDSLTGLGLGVEKPNPEIMRQPPRPQNEPLLTVAVALRAYLFLGPIEAAAGMSAFFLTLSIGGWRHGDQLAWTDPLYLRATCACLSALIVMQIVNVFLCRSSTRSVVAMPFLGNPLIMGGVALEIALLLVVNYLPLANRLLGTLPIPAAAWLLLIPFALGMLALEELRKAVRRRMKSTQRGTFAT